EPTNHLDIRSKDILMDSLRDYGGTIVFVSHDRYFLDGLANRVLEIGNGTAAAYLGNYEDYVRKKDAELRAAEAPPPPAVSAAPARDEAAVVAGRKRKVNPIRIRKIREEIKALEGKIELDETRIAVLGRMLASEELYRDHQLFRATMEEHNQLQAALAISMSDWERLHADLEAMQSSGA
ncbi:MAG: ABC-F family ATP-binding cassette domain-containing protein, partial [Acidobacteria bacterium]|nr:ABC-F family ATP-binding cassette domain-containing protein [Acidobacteriota bacterium]